MIMNIQLVARQLEKTSKYATHYIPSKEKHSFFCHVFRDGQKLYCTFVDMAVECIVPHYPF